MLANISAASTLHAQTKYQRLGPSFVSCDTVLTALASPATEWTLIWKVLGNRSAALSSLGRFEESLNDACAAVCIDPMYVKGYYRQATGAIPCNTLPSLHGGEGELSCCS